MDLEKLKKEIVDARYEISMESWNEFCSWLIAELDFDCDYCENNIEE